MTRFVLVGRSRAGRTVAAALRGAGFDWAGTWNRTPFVPGEGEPVPVALDECTADLHVLAVRDDALAEVAERLVAVQGVRRVIHLSGAAGHVPLTRLEARGVATGFVHPVRSFPAADLSGRGLEGAPCGVSLSSGMADIRAAIERCGATTFAVPAGAEVAYHTACTVAANLTIALLDVAQTVWRRSGLSEDVGQRLLSALAAQCAEGASRNGTASALTGPAARGDADVLTTHLAALSGPEREIYRLLSLRAVDLIHHGEDRAVLRRLLEAPDDRA